jgi:hypothetical protein
MSEVTGLLARYLTASPDERLGMRTSYPDVFCDEVMLELAEAETLMLETDASVRDIHGTFGSLVTELSLPGLTAEGGTAVPRDALFAHNFNKRLTQLFGAVWQAPAVQAPRPKAWYEATGVMDALFAFMPIMEILCVGENTCRGWRTYLCAGSAQPLWIGCVQREFPQELGALVAAEGSKLFESDWRTIAMLVCSCDESES